ncbi:MAG: glycosyltransferase [Candidatus Omnitrophica bacterium]|nr:glycosyltransferase [Candidatus Omnitrophota bacterium]
MRILQVVNNLQYGGIEKLAVELSADLKAAGHESLIGCLEGAGPLAEEAVARGVRVETLGKRDGFTPRLVPALASLMKRERIDVVHTHNMGPLLYGSVAARLAGVRALINTRHGREEKCRSRFIWRLNDAVVAISEDAKRRLLAHNRLDERRVRVIYNGIELGSTNGHASADFKRQCGLSPQRRLIGTVGRLAQEKDHGTLLQAFAGLIRFGCDAELAIAGDGALKPSLERMAGALGIAGRVRLLGFRSDARALIGAFDLFALSSLTEGIALTLLEAMAARKPVVATEVGGNPEVVVDGMTGLLVPPQQPDRFAQAMRVVLDDPALAARFGEAGRRRVEEHFSVERMVREYVQLYELMLPT